MTALTKLGYLTVVAAADLADVDAQINLRGDARVGSDGVGKRAGMMVLQDNGSSDYNLAIALGDAPTDGWLIYGRESTVTPS
jgi:hypothetical protein